MTPWALYRKDGVSAIILQQTPYLPSTFRLFTVESLEFIRSNFLGGLSIIQRFMGTLFSEFASIINELIPKWRRPMKSTKLSHHEL